MKNVIFILVDSVFSECMGSGRTKASSTPFIDMLAKNGFYASNVYSYGPYTDAATIGLYCANPTLENYGYFYGINTAPYNHFKLFKQAGYETIGMFYPYYLLSSKTRKDIDWPIYTGGFKYESVWGGKLKYYKDKKDIDGLNDLEYKLIEKCMDLVFDCWLGFYDDISNEYSAKIVCTLKDETIGGRGVDGLRKEYKLFKNDTKQYIDTLLDLGMNHPLAKVNEFDYGKDVDKAFLREIYKRHKEEMRLISRTNIKYAIKNSPFRVKKAIWHLKKYVKTHNSNDLRYVANYGMLLFSNKMMVDRSLKQRNWQEVASLNKQIETLSEVLKNRNDDTKPFYASIHALEPHHNISYFSFDSFDHKLIDEEFDYVTSILSDLGTDFCGNVIYQLSLRYVDLCIKRLVDNLKKIGVLDNTVIALVADHGTSYTFNPLRNTVVNTFHKENYNIPVMIWASDMTIKKKTDLLYMSDDIMPTVMTAAEISHDMLKGKDMLSDDLGRQYVLTEYMGPGVPDMVTKRIWMSIRNNNYVIAYKLRIDEKFKKEEPFLIYDLENDKEELLNKKEIKNNEIVYLQNIVQNRFEQIKDNTEKFLDNIEQISFSKSL